MDEIRQFQPTQPAPGVLPASIFLLPGFAMSNPRAPSTEPFIASQRLFHLNVTGPNRLDWLAHARFSLRRRFSTDDPQRNSKTPATSRERLQAQHAIPADQWRAGLQWEDKDRTSQLGNLSTGWDEIQNREEFFLDPDRRLICVVDDAGLGKTHVLQQAAYLRSIAWPGHLVVRFEFADLMRGSTPLLGVSEATPATDSEWPILVQRFWGQAFPSTPTSNRLASRQLLERVAKTGRLTLVIDALDQTLGVVQANQVAQTAADAARVLADFLAHHEHVRCVVSGRPFAVQTHLDTLFADRSAWEFVQLDRFDEPQLAEYFGANWTALREREFSEGLVPRDLEQLRNLGGDLAGLRTQADIYAKCVSKSFEIARSKQSSSTPVNQEQPLLCLLAFELRRGGHTTGLGDELGESEVQRDQLDDFIHDIYLRHQEFLTKKGIPDLEAFQEALRQMNRLNHVMDPGVLSIPYTDDPLSRYLVWLNFRNRTLQDFYAARWLTQYSTSPDDLDWLHQHRPIRGPNTSFSANADCYELWRFVVEMPSELGENLQWLKIMEPLLVENPAERTEAVCSEMIFRGWQRLLSLAKKEAEGERSTADWQSHFAKQVKDRQPRPERPPNADVAQWAKYLLGRFLWGFAELALGSPPLQPNRPAHLLAFTGDRPAGEIAREISNDFIQIPAGEHWMGYSGVADEPVHAATSRGQTKLARHPLTNEAFALFSPRHTERFGDYSEYSPEPRCPVIYVNWYDAWCVATWMHALLPDEYEWEAACRAQFWQPGAQKPVATKYWFGDDQADLKQHAWFHANSSGRTHPVGQPGHANVEGFSDMHGQVWEWTRSPYTPDPRQGKDVTNVHVARVLRGGAFDGSVAVNCRSAYRDRRRPADSDSDVGVRLARAESL